ncbi:MAG: BlaI/MecI/CopY family transcriptional regulator [Bacteroidaceae bacterium]|nr:BlaI/MecI/CopY family transcriptional regulator [Bacteroidaceae bacterium]MBR2945573.1 BlaI/MecI/CopY family transcriptional regulator [Bacteroidaceae bacterium]
MKRNDQTLTRVEFQLMNIIWDMKDAFCAWDVLEKCGEPKPAYTTVATYLKILREKGYVDCRKESGQGKTLRYRALVSREEYTRRTMDGVKKDFFGGSLKSMLSYFVQEENLSGEQIMEMLDMIREEEEK